MRWLTLTLSLYSSIYVSVAGPVQAAELTARSPVPAAAATDVSVRAEVRKASDFLATGDYSKAENSLRLALASAADAESTRIIQNALADLLREEGRLTEARPVYQAVLDSDSPTLRQRYDAWAGLADIDGLTHNLDMSTNEWDQAIAVAQEMKSPGMEADALRGLGMTWLDAANPSRAEPLLRRALKMMEDNPDVKRWTIASTLACIGRCYRMQNKLALAEDSLTRALDVDRKAFGEGHPQVAYITERLAEIYALRGQFDLARDYSERALAVMRACCGENSAAVVAALVNRAAVEQHANALDAAASNYAAALKIVRSNPALRTQNPAFEVQIIERYTVVLKAAHRDREAKELSAMAKSFRSNLMGANPK